MLRISNLLAGVATMALGSTAVVAQESAPDPEQQTASVDIIVTAQRRTERLIDVPLSVAVTTGEELERLNLNSAADLQFTTPGLSLGDSNTPRGAGFRVRGVGTTVFADGIEQSVGTVVDGVPMARAGQGLSDLADLERIEVLRGPQGLLFGRNASAGLINIITRRPTRDLSIIANASYASDDEIRLGASIAGPLADDSLRARLTGYLNRRDGTIRNITTGKLYNDRNEYGLRGQLLFEPSNTIEVVLRGDWSKRDNDANIWSVRQFATRATDPRPSVALLSSITGPITSGPRAREVNNGGIIVNEVESYGGSAEINMQLGEYTITSLSAYREWSQADNNDADLSPLNVLDRNFGGNDVEQKSQELRLTSPSGNTVEFVAGLFYFDTSNRGNFSQVGRFSIGLARALPTNLTLAPGLVLPAGQLFGRDVNTDIDVTDYAAFGQATLNLTDALSFTAGGRVTNTKVSLDYARTGTPGSNAFNFVLGAAFAPLAFKAKTEDTNFSWRLGAKYDLSEDANIYASVARGYKGPGFNNLLDIVVPTGTTPQAFTKVEPEIPTAFEIGFKGALLDRTLTVSFAAFLSDFKDFQAQIVEFQPGSSIGSFAIRNAGKLRTKGFEIELNATPTDGLTFGVGLAYTDAKFKNFAGASCPRLGALVTVVGAPCGPRVVGSANSTSFDAAGLRAPNSPEWTGNVEGRYEFGLTSVNDLRAFVQGNYYLRSDTVFGLYPRNIRNQTEQDGYGILNASLGVIGSDGKYTLSVFARNLFDTNYVTGIADLPFDGAGGLLQFVTPEADRTIGAAVNLRF